MATATAQGSEDINGSTEKEIADATSQQTKMLKITVLVGIVSFVVAGIIGGIIGYFIGFNDGDSNSDNDKLIIEPNGCNTTNIDFNITDDNDDTNNDINDTDDTDDTDGFSYPIYDYDTDTMDYSKYGQWETVVPTRDSPTWGQNMGIQSVHTVLLPSRKILIVNGASNRQSGDNITFYPEEEWPLSPNPLTDWNDFSILDKTDYARNRFYQMVNNNGFYDTIKNEFYRIPHPPPDILYPEWEDDWFYPNDLFCSDQLHVRDGNVLFSGGNEWYGPTFTGPLTTYLFNWTFIETINWNQFDYSINPMNDPILYKITNNTWIFTGLMKQGKWYPRSISLMDGRLIIVSGIRDYATIEYPSQVSTYFDIFDYNAFLINNTNGWRNINVENKENSPFSTPLEYFPPSDWVSWICSSIENGTEWNDNPNGCGGSFTVNKDLIVSFKGSAGFTCEQLKNDSIRLYPHMYLLSPKTNRILITGSGEIWWLNNCTYGTSGAARRTRNSYIYNVVGTRDDPDIVFEHGPKHFYNVSYHTTSIWDPNNSSRILNFGGQNPRTKGAGLPGFVSVGEAGVGPDGGQNIQTKATTYAGSGRGSRQLEIYTLPTSESDIGEWSEPDLEYMGPSMNFDRMMHYATLLPTKEILINGGTNYKYYGSVRSPLLLIPKKDENGVFTGKYYKQFVAPSRWMRSYHNAALLLPDGRVYTSGGNLNQAPLYYNKPISSENGNYTTTIENRQPKPNLNRADTFGFLRSDFSIADLDGMGPQELYVAEIFSPPYLFIDPNRRAVIIDYIWNNIPINITYNIQFNNQTYYLMHSLNSYTLTIDDLPDNTKCSANDSSVVLMKLGSSTHGWDAGQRLFDLPIDLITDTTVTFTSPDANEYGIVPAFYMLFFVDCMQKPAISLMVRFDDEAIDPLSVGI